MVVEWLKINIIFKTLFFKLFIQQNKLLRIKNYTIFCIVQVAKLLYLA